MSAKTVPLTIRFLSCTKDSFTFFVLFLIDFELKINFKLIPKFLQISKKAIPGKYTGSMAFFDKLNFILYYKNKSKLGNSKG